MPEVRRILRLLLVAAVCAVTGTAAWATPKAGVGIDGRVSDEDGNPLVGAVVSVFGKNLTNGARIVVTDEAGAFELDAMPPGSYRLKAYLAGFLPSQTTSLIIREGVEQVSSVLMSLAQIDAEVTTLSRIATGEPSMN